jgi:signal transduction histidine kinase
VFLADHRFLEKEWLTPAGLRVALTDRRGRLVVGTAPSPESRPAARPASATGLPWTVQALTIDDDQDTVRRRRMLLLAGLVVLVALIVTGGWFIGHSVARELEVARLQSDFVAAVSHEFRTPLTTLCQLSELLRRGRVRGDEDRQAYYELLHTESHRLRHLVEGVLNFGRVEGGRMPLEFRRVDLAALVQQSAAEFAKAPQAATHKLDVTTEGAPAVRGSEEALRCVIWNLLENAVKYSPDGERVHMEIVPNGHHVEISVRDHGIGIPPREQRRIFEKFVRGSAARERNIRGTGLGLAIARQIVRAHGGDITVESEVDEGSTFRVRLPKETAV